MVEVTRLYQQTDQKRINQILQHLNPKYLLGRLEFHQNKKFDKSKPFSLEIKYDGCIFYASRKTLEKECWRRVKEGSMIAKSCIEDTRLWNSSSRFVRFGYIDKNKVIRYAK